MANPEYEEQRYRIVSDNSGHEYFIPVELTDEFYKWVEFTEEDAGEADWEGDNFTLNRIDGNFTFTDPRSE